MWPLKRTARNSAPLAAVLSGHMTSLRQIRVRSGPKWPENSPKLPKINLKMTKIDLSVKKWLKLIHFLCSRPFWLPKDSCATFFQWRGRNKKKIHFFCHEYLLMGGWAQTLSTSKSTLKPYVGAFAGNFKRVFLRRMHFCVHLFQPKKGHFWSPEGLFLAKNLKNKVFSVQTIQNLTFWNPKVAP